MSEFPRTMVGGVSMPRLICGSNSFFGFSHFSGARDRFLRELFDTPSKIADVLEVFVRAGCNAVMSLTNEPMSLAIRETQQRTGVPVIWISTPGCQNIEDLDEWKKTVEITKAYGAAFCFPHTSVTDRLLDRVNGCLHPILIEQLRIARDNGLIPGLSTHEPESIIYSDATGADVESYVQPYNATGFLCRVETDWMERIINNAKKPVMTIKPLAAGAIRPQTGLAFVWNTIRDCDMVTIGAMSPYEAEEAIEISLACLESRAAEVELQVTRSKKGLTGK